MIYFYKITNSINNKVYIGQSNKEKDRWRQHKYFGKNPEKTGQYIHQAMNKYGIENFEYEVIASCISESDADDIESFLIDQYNSRNKQFGYNIAPGGNAGWNRGLPKEQQPMFGKKQSEYFKKVQRQLRIGKSLSDDVRNKISASHFGKIHTKETKLKISKANKGVIRYIASDETKQKMSKAKIGISFSKEHKQNISIAHKGRKNSKEHNKNISLSHIGLAMGTRHPKSKLTNKQVEEIKEEYQNGNLTYKLLAIKYNVSRATIGSVINNKSYKY